MSIFLPYAEDTSHKLKRILGSHKIRSTLYAENTLHKLNELFLMMKYFCGMVDRRKVINFISSQDNCRRSSPSRISDTFRAGFELAQNLRSDLVE